jgi:hypothetical protein
MLVKNEHIIDPFFNVISINGTRSNELNDKFTNIIFNNDRDLELVFWVQLSECHQL